MNHVVIGIGSNIEPILNIQKAITLLRERFVLLAKSRFIQTSPVGFIDQDDFINGAVLIQLRLDLDSTKLALRQIEDELGRLRTENKFGPRTIDLDVVVWNQIIIDKDFYTYDFLKHAVLELLPELNY